MRKKNAISYNDCLFSCQLSSLFLTLFSATKQKWKARFCENARPFYGFDTLILATLKWKKALQALQLDAYCTAICIILGRNLMQIAW